MNEEYLGDGLYARFDGVFVWLRAPTERGYQEVGLDLYLVLPNFLRFIEEVKFLIEEMKKDQP
jgi:hypothetical protein